MTTPITRRNVRLAAGVMVAIVSAITYPEIGLAAQASEGNQSLVFELKPNVLNYNQSAPGLTMDEVARNDKLVQSVQKYLEAKKSPLAPYASKIVVLNNWEQALGITYVESNFCAKAANFNCGSIGVKPGHSAWKKFETPMDGFEALTKLLDKPLYKDRYNTCEEKLGVYVVPGSARWRRGCEQVEQDMKNLVAQTSANQSIAMTQTTQPTTNKEIAMAN